MCGRSELDLTLLFYVLDEWSSWGQWILTDDIRTAIIALMSVLIAVGGILRRGDEEEFEWAGTLLILSGVLFGTAIIVGLLTSIYLLTTIFIMAGCCTFVPAIGFVSYPFLDEYFL